jgi:FCD domain
MRSSNIFANRLRSKDTFPAAVRRNIDNACPDRVTWRMQPDLQTIELYGRWLVMHQAVSRLAADTLIIVRPRQGLQIAPIDLARERVLLRLRRDMDRFVIRLAAERSGSSHRHQMVHITRALRERGEKMTVEEFNALDRRINRLIIAAANEPFLERTLRPLAYDLSSHRLDLSHPDRERCQSLPALVSICVIGVICGSFLLWNLGRNRFLTGCVRHSG